MSKIIYDKVEVRLCDKSDPITVELAKEIMGYEELPEKSQVEHHLKLGKRRIRFNNNNTNRPLRIGIAKKYANDMLRKKWKLNGETIVIDNRGGVQSAQHRLIGLILAEELRQENVSYWKENYKWHGPVSFEGILVTGISDHKEVTDTLDLGQKRTLADVVFRNRTFEGKDVTDTDQKALATILATAAKVVWMRMDRKQVSDAPHFPHSEALEFIESHPKLVDASLFVYNEDGGKGADGQKIKRFVNLGYAAALLYLQASTATDADQYEEEGLVNFDNWDKACEFWVNFASGANLEADNPILVLRNYLPKVSPSGAFGQANVQGVIINAYNLWAEGQKAKGAQLKVKTGKDPRTERPVLLETPRLGGLDIEREYIPLGEQSKGGWKVGDLCWVQGSPEEEAWFGEITEIDDKTVMVKSKDDKEVYETQLQYCLVEPAE